MYPLLILSVLISLLLFFYAKWKQSYWKRRGLYQLKSEFFFGNTRSESTSKKSIAEAASERYKLLKSANHKHAGIYMFLEPIYVPIDLTIIKNILEKDFSHFMNHGFFHHPQDILSMNLFNLENVQWQKMRSKLSPTFTSGKLKMMFHNILNKGFVLEKVTENYVRNKEGCDIKDLCVRYGMDVIVNCAYGIEVNALENPEIPLRHYSRKLFESNPMKIFLCNFVPWNILGRLNFKYHGKELTKLFSKIIPDIVRYREKNNIVANDIMQQLINLKNSNDPNTEKITMNDIIGESFIFYVGGFETISATITFALLELARHQNYQNELRSEINKLFEKCNGKISFDGLMEMKFMEQVFNETLRMYPPVPNLTRVCNKTYNVPGTKVVIEKGTRVDIPLWAIQRDPEHFENPNDFNPENFNDENKVKRSDFIYFPFGEGPRTCIGARFGRIQVKVALFCLLRKYKFTVNKKTQLPIKMQPSCTTLHPIGDVWLNVEKI